MESKMTSSQTSSRQIVTAQDFNAELEALARRAVACPRWRWMPGMGARCWSGYYGVFANNRVSAPERDAVWLADGWLPNLSDPATLGCLLYLVREAWGDPGFYPAQSGTKIKGTDIFGWDTFGFLHGKSCRGMLYRSEAEALVAALEIVGSDVDEAGFIQGLINGAYTL